MAFISSYKSNYGFTAPEAYFKIINYMASKKTIRVSIAVYNSKDSRLLNAQPIGNLQLDFKKDHGATKSEIYSLIKALPEYANAIDA